MIVNRFTGSHTYKPTGFSIDFDPNKLLSDISNTLQQAGQSTLDQLTSQVQTSAENILNDAMSEIGLQTVLDELGVNISAPQTSTQVASGQDYYRVLILQRFLNSRGANIAEDGVLGPATTSALQRIGFPQNLTLTQENPDNWTPGYINSVKNYLNTNFGTRLDLNGLSGDWFRNAVKLFGIPPESGGDSLHPMEERSQMGIMELISNPLVLGVIAVGAYFMIAKK